MPEPIPVALVITELAVGGAERCLTNLAIGIDKERFEPVVYSIRPRPASGKDLLVEQLAAAGVAVRFADIRSKWQAPLMVRRLKRLLAEQQPQIVQNFLYHANVAGTLAAAQLGVPHILMGMRVADPRRLRSWLERWLAADVERIVCVSQSVAEHSLARGFRPEKVTVIPNGIDLARFADVAPFNFAQFGVPSGRKAIVYLGRLDPQKGLDDLLRVTPRILGELPDRDLLLVGDGPQRQALVKQAASLGIAPRVHFAGWQSEVPAILAAAEMLVLPSRWEGMPNAVLEAMAAGKPVVATQTHGVVELLGDAAPVQTVPVGEAERFAKLVIHVSQNPQVAAKLGQFNRDRAVQEFSLPAMIGRYERLYLWLMDH